MFPVPREQELINAREPGQISPIIGPLLDRGRGCEQYKEDIKTLGMKTEQMHDIKGLGIKDDNNISGIKSEENHDTFQ